MVASVPELTMRTSSMDGTSARTRSAMRTSSSVGAPKLKPLAAAWRTASTTAGWACPITSGPQDST